MVGNFNAFLLKLVALLELFPQLEFPDQVILPIALTMVVALAVLPQNLVAFTEADDAGFIGSWMVPVFEFSSTLAKARKPVVRGVMLAFPGR